MGSANSQSGNPGVVGLTTSAEQGHVESQFALGLYYRRQEDLAQAVVWLKQAAEAGYPHAMFELGELYQHQLTGREIEAVRWLAAAADEGVPAARGALGLMFYQGYGPLEIDCEQALKWLELAVWQKDTEANNNLVWTLATCPDERFRDGGRAIRLGRDLVYRQGPQNARTLDTLAAAYAAAGDFLTAEQVQQRAISALSAASSERLQSYQRRLNRYQQRLPWLGASRLDGSGR